jgi:hypothetical protein
MGCEFEGKVEAHDTVGILPADEIFKVLGKDTNTGYILLRCPSCGENIAVDPLKSFFGRKMKGYPVNIRNEESIREHFQVNTNRVTAKKENMESDVSQSVPCGDRNCIGTINDQGVCNICGKPYIKKSIRQEGKNVRTYKEKVIEMSKDLVDALEKMEDPFEILGKATQVYVTTSAIAICAASLADPNKKGLEEDVEEFIANITPALKDDILEVAKTLYGMPVCPHCGAGFNPIDYRQDAPEWYCTQCGKTLPRE